MDDNKGNSDGNQSKENNIPPQQPIFETVPIETQPSVVDEHMNPEEVAPDVAQMEDVSKGGAVPEVLPSDQPLVYEESKKKYVIFGAVFVLLLLLILVIIVASGGKKKNTIVKKDINVTYWGLWEEKEVMDPLIATYEKRNPGVNILYEKKDPTDYREKLIVRSQNGQGPDIFRFHNTWLSQITEVADALPKEIMSDDEFEKTFYPIHQKDLKMGKDYYGLPLYIDGLVLVYNEDLFKKAGLAKAPSNWDELIEDAGKIQVNDKDGGLITSGVAIGTASNIEHFSDILGLMIVLNGGNLTSLDSPESVGALEAFRRFAEPPNNTWSEAMPNSVAAFIQQKVAMIIVPSWEIMTIKGADPSINIKVVPIPKPPGGKQISLASYWVEGVSKMSKQKKEAWKFLKYLTEKDTMTKLYGLQSDIRVFGTPYSRVDLANLIAQDAYVGPVIQQAQNEAYISLPLVSRTFDKGLNDEIVRYLENAVNGTIKGVSYQEALSVAKKGIDQIFERYHIE